MKNDQNFTEKPNSFVIPKHLVITGKLLQSVSPSLATSFASKLISKPFRHITPERELMMRQSAKNKLVKLDGIKKKVMVYSYGYSKKKILLVHGWSGRGTQLYQIADKILENKMMVISFDAPAHGLSLGSKATLVEFIAAIHSIEKIYGPFDAGIGHSLGGMALLNTVKGGLRLNNLVIIGTDNSIQEFIESTINKISLQPLIAKKLITRINKQLDINIEDYASQNVAKYVSIPTLVIHDSQDKIVDVSSALAIRQNLKNGELLMTHGLGHNKILRDPGVIQRTIDFIT